MTSSDLYRWQPTRHPSEEEPVKYSDLRWRLFSMMITNPDKEWSAPALAVRLDCNPQAATPSNLIARTGAIRDTLHMLMADRWVEPVPFQRALTVRLTATGRTQLRHLLLLWSAQRRADDGDT